MSESSAEGGSGETDPLLPMILVGNGIIGGVEEYVLSMLREFRRRDQRALIAAPFVGDFTSTLLEQGHPAEDLYILEMSFGEIPVRSLAQLTTLLRARQVDLIHTHFPPADVLGATAAAHVGIPAISTLHGIKHSVEEVLLHGLYGVEYVAVSRAGEASAIARGLPVSAIRYITNGVDTRRFDPSRYDRRAIRQQLGIREEQILVTSVARLSPEKNPMGFVRAAEIAAEQEERLIFLMVGTGPLEPELRRFLTSSSVGGRLRLLGARRDVPTLLAASDLLGLTSNTESLPFAVLEAMAMQLPVVCYEVGGIPELVAHGENGFLVRSGDTRGFAARVTELAADPALRRRLGKAGRQKVLEHFDFRHTVDALLALYRTRVNGYSRNGARAAIAVRPAPKFAARPPGGNGAAAAAPALFTSATPNGAPHPQQEGDLARPVLPIIDSHLHLSGRESYEQVLETLDGAGIQAACLIGPFLDPRTWVPATGAALQRSNEYLIELVERAPDQLWGLFTVDPRSPSAPREVEEYSRVPVMRGLKLIPHGWSPDDSDALRVYEACEACAVPILFHSGIFISGRSSDACRPAKYEAVRRFPRLRVVLAHLGWPWVDEAIAVAFMDPLKGEQPQIFLDTSPGTPPIYRRDALRKALAVIGSGPLLWGSDRFLPAGPELLREHLDQDLEHLHALGASVEDLNRIFSLNAAEVFTGGVARANAFPRRR